MQAGTDGSLYIGIIESKDSVDLNDAEKNYADYCWYNRFEFHFVTHLLRIMKTGLASKRHFVQ